MARTTRALVTLVHGGGESPLGRVVADDDDLDLALVDALARLQLHAGRLGCSVRLRAVCPRLADLLDVAGLAALLGACSRSALEARRQAEAREQLDVEEGEEVVDGGDLLA